MIFTISVPESQEQNFLVQVLTESTIDMSSFNEPQGEWIFLLEIEVFTE